MYKRISVLLAVVCCSMYTSAQQAKTTGILGAFNAETNLLVAQLQQPKEQVIQGIHFSEGTLNGAHVVIAQTGIGKVNAAITTTLMVEHFIPASIIFTGIAGGVNPSLAPGDLVIGTTVAYHDYGSVNANGMLHEATRNPVTAQNNPLFFPCDSLLVQLAVHSSKQLQFQKAGIPNAAVPVATTGTIVTGDVFVSSAAATEQLRTQLHADATEMEGAAVAQVCWQQHIPFLVIRSVSDKANGTAAADIVQFYTTAAHNSAMLVREMMRELK
ncbi:5'-methylthioadenosine/adenosylhomocysteine nucleosidase [Deminuibacter soli]|uniref:adenosylhomocysteine nucleosidase n=1 Tax=Deminuibacter soli TaxID=2291815 RepID=A0A3E1NGN7_9BACT|nr:5'-methylthioadenosine/adenosylhomocysteine nucleosidase [Deminuibacter soli]RFM27126.1 5'-methylthioadenosine/adenosylhomocysteine nucleosidase [Deminuibacter soli]